MPLSTIAILSPGLMGGSLALAIRERLPRSHVRIWARKAESARKVLDMGLADEASTDAEGVVKGARLVIFCMPIGAMGSLAEKIAHAVEPAALVTDVGSVKGVVVDRLGPIFRGRFVGSHPMAGSERTGVDAARADLFEGAVTFLTPEDSTPPQTTEGVADFWKKMGSRVAVASPRAHDDAVALVSHLPHLAAAALVNVALHENPAALEWRGSGFLDTTRVASGAPAMWTEILLENREAVARSILALVDNLSGFAGMLQAGDPAAIEDYLAQAREARDRMKRAV